MLKEFQQKGTKNSLTKGPFDSRDPLSLKQKPRLIGNWVLNMNVPYRPNRPNRHTTQQSSERKMSFFGGNNASTPGVNDMAVKQAKLETEILTDLYNK